MRSFQNLRILQQLYRYKALGYKYIEPISINTNTKNNYLPNQLQELEKIATACKLCDLSKTRNCVMFGWGNPNADVMFLLDEPTVADDGAKAYFQGRSGKLLEDMIQNVLKLNKEQVYLTSSIKCRSPQNRAISQTEVLSCKQYLLKQIELIKPKVIVCLGIEPYGYLTQDTTDFAKIRGQKISNKHYDVVITFNPYYLIRNPSLKKDAFSDLLLIKSLL